MELYQLKTFATVADTGNVSRAAQILHTSQPAVSAQIKALEDEFGVTLFERTARGVLLTPSGKKIKEKIERILDATRDFAYFLAELKNDIHVVVTLALNTDAGVLKIKELLSGAAREHPETEFRFLHSSTMEIVRNISSGMIDAGFIFGSPRQENLELIHLTAVDLVIAAPAAWRDKFETAQLRAILELPWIMPPENCPFYFKVNELFRGHALKPVKLVSSDHETTTLQLVQSGIGVSLLPEFMCLTAAQRGELVLWRGGSYTIDLCFAFLKKNKEAPGIKLVLELLEKVWFPPK
jgi:DNA-binding transcriptional LysR family regulator